MNRFFRVIWSRAHHALIVVPEVGPANAGQPKKRGQKTRKALQTLRAMAALAGMVIVIGTSASAEIAPTALPQNGRLAAGQATIGTRAPGVMVIDQASDRAVINWDSFDIGHDAQVSFRQPGRNSAVLNRVADTAPSQVLGQLSANGQVFVANRNGVYFGRGAQVNVGGLVATTHDMADKDFMEGNFRLDRDGATGAVVNDGQLSAADGGYIALLAPEVRNHGVITARLGTVALAGGEVFELSMGEGGALAGLRVEASQIETLVENGHLIQAPGGKVIMTTGAARELRAGVVRNTGTIEARGIQKSGGRVFLGGGRVATTRTSRVVASTALHEAPRPMTRPSDAAVHIQAETVSLSGVVDTRGTTGGSIAVEAAEIDIASNAHINASGALAGGHVLIGGDWQGGATAARVFDQADAMQQAQRLSFSAGAVIDASAIEQGDGGTIALWSDVSNGGVTLAHGTLRSEGGAQGGDGGRVETSGFALDVAGISVSTRAAQGAVGDWLLDPGNIEIVSGGTDSLPGGTGPLGTSQIDPTTIETALAGSNVTVTTGADGGEYTLTVTDNITYTGAGERTLTFGSDGRMFIFGDISATIAPLNLVFASEIDRTTDFTGAGRGVTLGNGVQLSTQGGDVWIGGGELSGTWNGHTVGVGAAMGGASNQIGVEFELGAGITTNGGDLRLVGASSTDTGIGAYKSDGYINLGTGNAEFVTDKLDFHYEGNPGVLSVQTTGSFTLTPFSDSFESDLVWNSAQSGGYLTASSGSMWGLRVSDTISSLTLGKPTNTRDISISSNLSIGGAVTVDGGAITLAANLDTSGVAGGDVTLKAKDNIVVSGNVTTNNGHVVLWSDSDDNGGDDTSIMVDNSDIATNGGDVWMGGSYGVHGDGTSWLAGNGDTLTVGDGYALNGSNTTQAAGIMLQNGSVITGGGNVALYGYSIGDAAATQGYGLNIHGQSFDTGGGDLSLEGVFNGTASTVGTALGLHFIAANGNASSASTGAGDMTLTGITAATSRYDRGGGMQLSTDITYTKTPSGGLSLSSTTGDITLNGTAERAAGAEWAVGVVALSAENTGTPNDVSITTTTGNIAITGAVEADMVGNEEIGVGFSNFASGGATQTVATDGGTITISGQNGPHNSSGIDFRNDHANGGVVIGDSNTGAVTLRGDRVTSSATYATALDTAGVLTIEPLSGSFEVSPSFANFTFGSRLGGLTYGKAGNSAAYTSTQAFDVGGDVAFYTGETVLNHAVNADGAVTVETTFNGSTNSDLDVNAAITAGGDVTLITSGNGSIALNNSVTSSGDILFKTEKSIAQFTGADVVTSGGDITYWADSDGSGEGSIQLVGASATGSFVPDIEVRSQGGDIVMGGGAASVGGKPTGAAGSTGSWRQGVRTVQTLIDASVAGATEAATSGNVSVRGYSTRTGGTGNDLARGVMAMNTRIYANQVTIDGEHSTMASDIHGFDFNNLSQINAYGDVTLAGKAAAGGSALRFGVNPSLSSVDGNITFNIEGELAYHSAAPITINAGRTVTVNMDTGAGTGEWTTEITGAGGFTKAGAGTLTFGGTQSYTGATHVSAGVLELEADLSQSIVTVDAGAELSIPATQQIGGLAGAGDVDLNAFTLAAGGLNTDTTFSGAFKGTGGFMKSGSGRMTLTGSSSHTGGTLITGGTLALGTGGGLVGSILNNSAFVVDNTDNITLAGAISGTGTVEKSGSGTLTLSGNNSYAGLTTVNNGMLSITHNNGLGATSAGTTLAGGATLQLKDGISVSEDISTTGAATLQFHSGANTLLGDLTAADSLTVQNLSGFQTISGDVNAAGQTLTIDNDGFFVSYGAVTAQAVSFGGHGHSRLLSGANAMNSVSTFETTGLLELVNGGALTIGEAGVSSDHTVSILTQSGDLTIAGDVTTTGTLLQLMAGRTAAAGTASGGDIIVSGAPTLSVGTGGQIQLFTGSVSGSTGLTDLVGFGTGRFRYNSDETTTNYTAALGPDVAHAIYRENIALTGSASDSTITYGDATPTSATGVSGAVNGDTVVLDVTSPSYAGSGALNVGSYAISTNALGYDVSAVTGGTLTVEAKTINASGAAADDRTYDGTTSATLSGALALSAGGVVAGDDVSLSGAASASFADANAGSGKAVSISGVTLSGADAGNYVLTLPGLSADITRRVVGVSATRAYDGTTDLTGDVTVTTGVAGETLGYSGATALGAHVATAGNFINALTLTDGTGLATNYALPVLNVVNAPVAITQRVLTAALVNNSITKIYDGTTNAPDGFTPAYTLSGFALGDTAAALSHLTLGYDNADVATASQIIIDGLSVDSITGTLGSQASDYALAATSLSTAATITRAPLTVTANNHAKFINQTDTPGFAGGRYDGFVGGETAAVLGGALIVSRSNAATNVAGEYAGVLQPSGLSADNYAITYQPGDFTIIPSGQLWAEITDQTHIYGSQTPYEVTRVSYFDGTDIIQLQDGSVAGSSVSIDGTNGLTINDGAGGTATLQLAPSGAQNSSAELIKVGSYQIGVDGPVTENSANFSETVTVTGRHTVTRKTVAPSVAGGVSRVYDGTRQMSDLLVTMAGVETGDTVTITGTGAFDSADAGTGKGYSITNLALTGADAGNYYLTGGSSTLVGTNGTITPRTLLVSYTGVDKIYDGNTSATVIATDDRLAADDLTITQSATFDSKNVGTGKTVTVSGITLTGADAGNYTVNATSNTTANITRLATVTWIGGPTGNWHDPANWAGGAVPDLSNVAHVVIPDGVVVTFGTPPVAPAEAGPVHVDGIGSGGTLVMQGETLNVGADGIAIEGIQQSGGVLTSGGGIAVETFEQTGGTTTVGADLTVTQNFAQNGTGTVDVAGDAVLTDINGGMQIGNLSVGGNFAGTSTDGPITQSGSSAITINGTTMLAANAGGLPADITLDGALNDFGQVAATGKDITLVDANDLTLTDIIASGTLTTTSEGDLTLGGDVIADAAHLTSNNGSVRQPSGSLRLISGPNSIRAHDSIIVARNGNVIDGGLVTDAPTVALTADTDGMLAVIDAVITGLHGFATNTPMANQPAPISVSAVTTAGANGTDGVSGAEQLPNGAQPERVTVFVPLASVRLGETFSFRMSGEIRALAETGIQPSAEMLDGTDLPDWLRFDANNLTFSVVAAPAEAFPARVQIILGSRVVEVLINAR